MLFRGGDSVEGRRYFLKRIIRERGRGVSAGLRGSLLVRIGGEIFWLREQAAEGGFFSWLINRDFEAEQNFTGEGHSQV